MPGKFKVGDLVNCLGEGSGIYQVVELSGDDRLAFLDGIDCPPAGWKAIGEFARVEEKEVRSRIQSLKLRLQFLEKAASGKLVAVDLPPRPNKPKTILLYEHQSLKSARSKP